MVSKDDTPQSMFSIPTTLGGISCGIHQGQQGPVACLRSQTRHGGARHKSKPFGPVLQLLHGREVPGPRVPKPGQAQGEHRESYRL